MPEDGYYQIFHRVQTCESFWDFTKIQLMKKTSATA